MHKKMRYKVEHIFRLIQHFSEWFLYKYTYTRMYNLNKETGLSEYNLVVVFPPDLEFLKDIKNLGDRKQLCNIIYNWNLHNNNEPWFEKTFS